MTPTELQAVLERLDRLSGDVVELKTLITERRSQVEDHEDRLRLLERNGLARQGDRNLDHATISGVVDAVDKHEDRITELEAKMGRWSGMIAGAAAVGGVAGSGLVLLIRFIFVGG